MKYHLPL